MSDKLNLKLFNKYLICHADGSPLKGKKYFVLRLDSDDPAESVRVAAAMSAYKGETVGNPAKLRKALILCVDSARCIANHAGLSSRIASEALVIVNAAADALAAPARNCDVYDKEEVRMAYHLHGDGLMTMQAVVDWLYSAKKRGDESPRTEQESEVQG